MTSQKEIVDVLEPEEIIISFVPELTEDGTWTGGFKTAANVLDPTDYTQRERLRLFPLNAQQRQRWLDFVNMYAIAPLIIEANEDLATGIRAMTQKHLQRLAEQANIKAIEDHPAVRETEDNIVFANFNSKENPDDV